MLLGLLTSRFRSPNTNAGAVESAPAVDHVVSPSPAASLLPAMAAPVPAYRGASPDFMLEDQVDDAALLGLFRSAYMDVEIGERGGLFVRSESGPRMLVEVDAERKLIALRALHGFRNESSTEQRLRLVNRMNDQVVIVRFAAIGDDSLMADYFLMYAGGVTRLQVVTAVKTFGRVIAGALQRFDEEDVVR